MYSWSGDSKCNGKNNQATNIYFKKRMQAPKARKNNTLIN